MSVFHRVEDVDVMPADLFVRRAKCLPAYDGAVRLEARRQALEQLEGPGDTEQAVSAAPVDEEEALWAAHRQKTYAQYLAPGEVPREVPPAEGLALAFGSVS